MCIDHPDEIQKRVCGLAVGKKQWHMYVLPWEGRCGSQRVIEYVQPRFLVYSPLHCNVFAVSVILCLASYRLALFCQNVYFSLSSFLSFSFFLFYL